MDMTFELNDEEKANVADYLTSESISIGTGVAEDPLVF